MFLHHVLSIATLVRVISFEHLRSDSTVYRILIVDRADGIGFVLETDQIMYSEIYELLC